MSTHPGSLGDSFEERKARGSLYSESDYDRVLREEETRPAYAQPVDGGLFRGDGSFDLDLSSQRGSKPSSAPKQSDFAVGSPGDHLAAQMSSVAQANAAQKARAQAMQAAAEGRGVRQGDAVQAQDEGPQLG